MNALKKATMPHLPQKISILYVEDDLSTRQLVQHAFSLKPEYLVITASDGIEGLKRFKEQPTDLVLTDIMMPKLNGLEMARSIRAISPDCQIIVMSAFSETTYLVDSIDIGVNQFVIKPVEFKRLFTAIDRCGEVIRMKRQLQIQEAEVLRAKKMEAISVLAGGMAHDFNNLLQVILGYISISLCNSEPGSKVHEMLTIAERSSEEARKLSRRLLSLARGGLFNITNLDLRPILKECVDLARQCENISIIYQEPTSLSNVNIDPEQIYQMFSNIITNARESMPNGGTITIVAKDKIVLNNSLLTLPEGEYVHVCVQDTGCGISPELMPDIFDPYITTKPLGTTKGVGLGLTLSHAIVRKHKGRIAIDSRLNEGTTVHIYLPAAKAAL